MIFSAQRRRLNQSLHHRVASSFAAAAALAICLFAPLSLRAQASAAFQKSADISVWAGFTGTSTDKDTGFNKGGTVGVAFTTYPNFPIEPSIEARATFTDGAIDNLKSYDGGLRLAYRLPSGRLRVYGDFLAGFGTLHYVNCNAGYPAPALIPGGGPSCSLLGDNAPVYSPGGGVTFTLTPSFQVRGDVQYEMWNFGHDQKIHPLNSTIGLVYTLPFRPYTHHRDYR